MAVVTCQACKWRTQPEDAGIFFRCGNCRSAIDSRGNRFRGESTLKPWKHVPAKQRKKAATKT